MRELCWIYFFPCILDSSSTLQCNSDLITNFHVPRQTLSIQQPSYDVNDELLPHFLARETGFLEKRNVKQCLKSLRYYWLQNITTGSPDLWCPCYWWVQAPLHFLWPWGYTQALVVTHIFSLSQTQAITSYHHMPEDNYHHISGRLEM